MITDSLLQLSAAQAVTASAVSTNTIDSGAAGFDQGADLFVVVTVDQSVAAAGAATVTFQLIGSASPSLSSPTVLVQSDAIGKAELTAGRKAIVIRVPQRPNSPTAPRYFGLNYLVGTGPLTAGAFTANVTSSPDQGRALYAAQQNVV